MVLNYIETIWTYIIIKLSINLFCIWTFGTNSKWENPPHIDKFVSMYRRHPFRQKDTVGHNLCFVQITRIDSPKRILELNRLFAWDIANTQVFCSDAYMENLHLKNWYGSKHWMKMRGQKNSGGLAKVLQRLVVSTRTCPKWVHISFIKIYIHRTPVLYNTLKCWPTSILIAIFSELPKGHRRVCKLLSTCYATWL